MSHSKAVRVGYIDYLNTVPFYHGLAERFEPGAIELVRGVPTEINRLMREDKLDIALVSSLEYALAADRYLVLNDGCIGSSGITQSVILFSRHRLKDLNHRTVALSKASLSSATLQSLYM